MSILDIKMMSLCLLSIISAIIISGVDGAENCPGCIKKTEPVKEVTDFALLQLAGKGKSFKSTCSSVENFSKQVVQGLLYSFDLILHQTDGDKCKDSKVGEEERCHMKVWEKVWEDPPKSIVWDKVNCSRGLEDDTNVKPSPKDGLLRVPLTNSETDERSPTFPQLRVGLVQLGGDDHDLKSHGGDQEYVDHGPKLVGGGDHDFIPHGKRLLGSGTHDYKSHEGLLGGDDHDKKSHKGLLGKDGHGQKLLGIDDHDIEAHGQKLLGSDDHDQKSHGQKLLGGDDHDKKSHKGLLGKDGHGQRWLGIDNYNIKAHGKELLGGDDHDKKSHHALLGGGDHDFIPHGLLGVGVHVPKFDDKYTKKELLSQEKSRKALQKLQSLGSFHKYMTEHGKKYESKEEYKKRYTIFRDNMKKVQFLAETEQGTGEYGPTLAADLTETEFKKKFLGWNRKLDDPDIHWPSAEIPDVDLPQEFDWRTKGAVTEIKNQGQCGSCWAFSVTGNVEGQYAVKHGELLDLSEQELVDCDTRDSGCNGGLPENAYKTLLEIGGLETEDDYGYDGEDEACKFNRSKVAARVTGGVEISQNETEMAQWLLQNGPISVGLNAAAMQFYKGGVSHPWSFLCSPDGIDHGVLIVGFGEHEYPLFHKKMPYWIIKNSWGTGWGEQGYYRLFRGDGTCGINMMTSSAVVE